MNLLLNVYKPIGFTPLQVIQKVRETFSEYKEAKIGYAGRLDPLAHGVLLLMVGDATKERDKFLGLQKEYEFEVLFGFETDTYDMLGVVKSSNRHSGNPSADGASRISNQLNRTAFRDSGHIRIRSVREPARRQARMTINNFISKHIGQLIQPYPPYSSKAVAGKPLFWWAKQNRLSEITIPEREVMIEQFELLSMNELTSDDLLQLVQKHIRLVNGDFRQEEIINTWETLLKNKNQFQTAKFRISCSSGTYVRGLVHEMGQMFGTGAVALDILRTRVGDYHLRESLRL